MQILDDNGAIPHRRSAGVMNVLGVRSRSTVSFKASGNHQGYGNRTNGRKRSWRDAHDLACSAARWRRTRRIPHKPHSQNALLEQGNATLVPAAIIQVDELPVTDSGKRSGAATRDAENGRPC
jgi:hypothetical protein